MTKRFIVYTGVDDDVRSPIFSAYDDTRDWTKAKTLVRNKLAGSLFAPTGTSGYDVLHDLEAQQGITVWHPTQLGQRRAKHDLNKDFTSLDWHVGMEDADIETVTTACLERVMALASIKANATYRAAVSLLNQMVALKRSGIEHETTLCILRLCVSDLPSDLTREPVDPLCQEAHRGAFARLVTAVSGVETHPIYVVDDRKVENNPAHAISHFFPGVSYDQIVLENQETSVGDLEDFRERVSRGRGLLDLRGWRGTGEPVVRPLPLFSCPSCHAASYTLKQLMKTSAAVVHCDECGHVSCDICGARSFWSGRKCPKCESHSVNQIGTFECT